MAWLRLDDGFTKHPKFEGWPKSLRWDWLEAMEYCARYRTKGRLPTDISLLPRAVTPALLKRAEASGWCARGDDGALWINDWEVFNPPRGEEVEEAVQQALEQYPDASANEIYRHVGGNRNLVLDAIRRYRSGTPPGIRNGGESVSKNGIAEPVSRAHPVPSRPSTTNPAAALKTQDAAAAAAELQERLNTLGITLDYDPADTDRIHAWINLAQQEAETNPAGYVIAGVRTGAWPTPRHNNTTPTVDHEARARELYNRTHDPEAVADWLAGIHSLSTTERERILHEVAA